MRPVRTVSRDRAIDDAWIDLSYGGVREPQALDSRQAHVVDEDVRILQKELEFALALFLLQIELN
ncbi:hypothetical protein D9M68_878570 [compost metagenome]